MALKDPPVELPADPVEGYLDQHASFPEVSFGKDALNQMQPDEKLDQIIELLTEVLDRLGEIE